MALYEANSAVEIIIMEGWLVCSLGNVKFDMHTRHPGGMLCRQYPNKDLNKMS